jgi:hypothetical protein
VMQLPIDVYLGLDAPEIPEAVSPVAVSAATARPSGLECEVPADRIEMHDVPVQRLRIVHPAVVLQGMDDRDLLDAVLREVDVEANVIRVLLEGLADNLNEVCRGRQGC